jgi:hypothetical protein
MSRILKVSQSNYRIQTASNGSITLDTGSDVGTVYVTGDLVVQGNTTSVNTSQLYIEDRLITLNKNGGNTNPLAVYPDWGILADAQANKRSGIEIDRGAHPDGNAQLIFDEKISYFDGQLLSEVQGAFVLKTTTSNEVTGLSIAGIVNERAANFIFDLKSTGGMLRIANGGTNDDYYIHVADDDNNIPNWKSITNYVTASQGVATVDRLYFPPTAAPGNEDSKIQAFGSNIQFFVGHPGIFNNQNIVATLSQNGLSVNNVNILNDSINNTSSNNLVLLANNNNVEVNSFLNLSNQSTFPVLSATKTQLFSNTANIGPGKTGLFFKNTSTTGMVNNVDELVSKTRAVLLSILL